MSWPKVRCPVRVAWLLLGAAWTAAVAPSWEASAGELPPGIRYGAEDLHVWQNRLVWLDETTPAPALLGIERLIAYEENADFAYAFGERAAEAARRHASWSLMLRRR